MAPTTSCGTWTRFSARRPAEDSRRRMVSSVGFSSDSVFPGAKQLTLMLSVADFAREGARETDGGGFRRDVMDASRTAGEDRSRGDVDDLAGILLAHGRQHGAAAKKQAAQIHRHKRSHSAGSMVSILPRFIGTTEKTAALLMRTSMRPKRSRVCAAMSFVDSSSATSSVERQRVSA